MPKLPRWTALEAERALLAVGFELLRSKGSHRIYGKGGLRVKTRLKDSHQNNSDR